jgi:hypothetical protein
MYCRFLETSSYNLLPNGVMRGRISGVHINGIPWRTGNYCLYTIRNGGRPQLGKVTNMYHGVDEMYNDFVLFSLAIYPITHFIGHYCLYSPVSSRTSIVEWTRLTWKCKALVMPLRPLRHMALPIASCTSEELVHLL